MSNKFDKQKNFEINKILYCLIVLKKCREMQMTIDQYKNLLNELTSKNNLKIREQNEFKEEIQDLKGKLKEINNVQSDMKSEENIKIANLENEKQIFLHKENYYRTEIKQLSDSIKKYKIDLKRELDEKIVLLKEFEKLRITQKKFNENHNDLKSDVESAHEEIENLNNQMNILSLEKEELNLKFNGNLLELEEIKGQYAELYDQYNKILVENNEFEEFNLNKNVSDLEIYKIIDKYEAESFNLKCENNQLKNLLLEIINLQVSNADYLQISNIINIDKNYITNTPDDIKFNIDKIFNFLKNLLMRDKQNYSVKMLADNLLHEQTNTKDLISKLNNEIRLRRKIQNNYLRIICNFKVICRIRPFVYEDEKNKNIIDAFRESYDVSSEYIKLRDAKKSEKYFFDYVLGQNSTQQNLYDEVILLIDSFIKGKNVSVIAYGQTSTGKTHSIHGKSKENPGIAFRIVSDIFDNLKKNFNHNNNYDNKNIKKNSCNDNYIQDSESSELFDKSNKENTNSKVNKKFKLSLSIIEIYNENIYNLLADGETPLKIFENSNYENLVIPELSPIKIYNYEEATKLFKLAKTFRKTKFTNYNEHSSRSHIIFTFYLKVWDEEGQIKRSKFNIVDLAGSERLSKMEGIIDESIKKESLSINTSLNSLTNVLNAIASKNNHIPFRNSKLTHYLKDSLCGDFFVMLILHISPNIRDFLENLSTLEFGNRIYKMSRPKFKNSS